MAKHRMDVAAFVGKLLEQDDVDALQEGVKIGILMGRALPFCSCPRQVRSLTLRCFTA